MPVEYLQNFQLSIGDSTVKVIYYKHTILNVYHVYVWI